MSFATRERERERESKEKGKTYIHVYIYTCIVQSSSSLNVVVGKLYAVHDILTLTMVAGIRDRDDVPYGFFKRERLHSDVPYFQVG